MKIRAYITAYNRPKMLASVIDTLHANGIVPKVYEDGVTHPFRGKEGYWQTWDEILKDAEKHEADLYLFIQDDVLNVDIDKIKDIHNQLNSQPYVHHIINDGRHECWLKFQKQKPIDGMEKVGFTDCIFFCNRGALEVTKWRIKQPPLSRWKHPGISSGVGQQLTTIFTNYKISMYKPVESLGYHGDHESEMHPEERKKNPLTSK